MAHPIHNVLDRSPGRKEKNLFRRAKVVENTYSRALKAIASAVAKVIASAPREPDGSMSPRTADRVRRTLDLYSDGVEEWARAVANRMITEVSARDRSSWMEASRKIGISLAREIDSAPTGLILRQSLDRQVDLITSLPRKAGERVHQLALEAITTGRRAAEVAEDIKNLGNITNARAMLIARTEVGRVSTELSKARAGSVGSTHFIWRTSEDADVRETHRKLNGKVFRWDDPPECDPGHRALPGAIWNCRCWPEPVITDEVE